MMNRALITFGFFLLAAYSGCGEGGGTGTQRLYGEVGLVYTDTSGQTRTDRDATYDFGSVFMGQETTQKIVVKNLSKGTLVLDRLEKADGDAVRINNLGDENPAFQLNFEAGKTLLASEFVELEAKFTPPRVDDVTEKSHSATLVLRVQNAREGEDTATLTLVGKGVSDVCDLPKVIDFGTVAMGDSQRKSLEIRNPTQITDFAAVGEIQSSSGDHKSFRFVEGSASGDVTLAPESSARIEFEFNPTELKTYLAFLRIRASAQCPEQVVQLIGNSVETVLSWVPAQVDCGYATPGVQVNKQITFTNAGNVEVKLADIQLQNTAEFGILVDEGVDPTTLTVPALGGTSTLTVWCKPATLSLRQSPMTFNTNLRLQPNGVIVLRAMGGGPDVEVQPYPSLNFGKVAYFANAPDPVFQKRRLRVMNVGTVPMPPKVVFNLRLGSYDANGVYVEGSAVEINPLNPETLPGEFTVELPESYDKVQGLEATAGKNTTDLIVTVTPQSAGMKQAEIVIRSNDIDEPLKRVTVSAEAVVLPPCDFEVTPSTVGFGVISPPAKREMEFTIRNLGTNPGDTCLLAALDLDPTSHRFFSLVGGGTESRELQPGEAMRVRTRVAATGMTPAGKTDITGNVEFFISSPFVPHVQVPLTAQHAQSCLMFAADEVEFGTVQAACGSPTTTVRMYNVCGAALTLNAIGMLNAPTGDPTCLNTAGCEFVLQSAPTIPSGGLGLAANGVPLTLQVQYRPQDTGNDLGGVAVDVVQDGSNLTYVLPLDGSGATQGIHTDVFVRDAAPKADVLVLMDNYYYMSDEQQKFAQNIKAFMSYANLIGVDYHIAVAHPSDYSYYGGFAMFREGVGHEEKVLTRSTPDMERKFKMKVNVGTNGYYSSAAKATVEALTPPRINADHAGFLREDATLGVVLVSDFYDMDYWTPRPTSYYLDRFFGIKGHNRRGDFTWSAMAGFMPGCGTYSDNGDYAYYISNTGGAKENLCSSNWATSLEKLGTTAFGKRTQFFLTSTPDLGQGALDVQIDGVSVPDTDSRGASVWFYDQLSNSIRFGSLFAPQAGQVLTVTYYVPCITP